MENYTSSHKKSYLKLADISFLGYALCLLAIYAADSFIGIGFYRHADILPLVLLNLFLLLSFISKSREILLALWLIVISCVWSVFSGSDWQAVLLALLGYKYILAIPYLLVMRIKNSRFERASLIIAIACIPLSILQRYFSDDTSGDSVVGLFGAGGSGLLTMFLLALGFALIFSGKNKLRYVLSALIIFPILINETKIAFLLIFIYIAAIVFSRNTSYALKFSTILLALLSILVINHFLVVLYGQGLDTLTQRDFLDKYLYQEWGKDVGRILKYQFYLKYLGEQPLALVIIGYGIGSAFVGNASGYIGFVAYELSPFRVFEGTQLAILRILSEGGVFGCLLFFYWLAKAYQRNKYLTPGLMKYFRKFMIINLSVGVFYTDMLFNGLYMLITLIAIINVRKQKDEASNIQ